MDLILPIVTTFIIAFFIISFSKPIAIHFGLVDIPTERKAHVGKVPLIGGVAIFLSVLFGAFFFMPISQPLNIYLISAALIVFIGVLDDYYDLPIKPRMIAQITVASLMVFGADLYLNNLGNLFGTGDIKLNAFGTAFTIIAVVGTINAFNMVDGIDGLAGMLSIITFSALAFLLSNSSNEWFLLPALFVAATLAYLMFNLEWPSSKLKKIFMGDAGSMLIGLTVVWLLVVSTQSEQQSFKPVTALWIIAVPLMDMVAIMLRRIKKGQSPFKPDRDHLHHIFMRASFSSKQTLLIISLIAIMLTIFGATLDFLGISESISFIFFIAFFIVYTVALNHVWRLLTFFRKH
ncbi:UDP-N-acetylglucosamine--undecaprenyl-phosphate N-acetylglucosaminephosphotransferase [Gammaproteobacteria bacterium AS21]